ncbi:DNA helicase [Acinetobacter phage AbTZA1]|uniref:DNA helicase n=1 Tax=Acinetobacter phage AbTZA1 TaxID=2500827 RepID=A0A3Q9R779_9CAUD|nr:Dda-like helicase [Acinetobacter phage AbTZA1]AZU98549.1 DNA helicase [Acinetobacter phage AbTZA1]
MNDLKLEDLNEGQRAAFDAVMNVISSKSMMATSSHDDGPLPHITINGPAGTGKTTLTKFLISHLIAKGEKGVMLAAPTHQAKKVLSNLSGMDASTIHSLLKINPTTYEDSTVFQQSDTPDLSECRVLICDEVSMYDRELFRILMASIPPWCTVIGLGDIAQIRPVAPNSNVPELSAFFFNDKFQQVSLTEVMRSNAPIIEVATEIRQGGWIRENIRDGNGVHSMVRQGGGSVAAFLTKYFEIVKDPDDLFDNRMLAFTNKSVNDLNNIIRKKLYQTTEPYIVNEVLVMQEPLIRSHTFEGKTFSEIIFNNGELVRIVNCRRKDVNLFIKGFKGSDSINVWELEIRGVDSVASDVIRVIHDEQEMNKFQYFMSKSAGEFKNARDRRPNWKGWWDLRSQFHKVKPLPCGTIHKSQGSTLDNVFLFTPCIHRADPALAQQLLYVGATRAKNNVYFV